MSRPKILESICVLVLVGIVVAGLAPFRRPRNHVTWLENKNGLRFNGWGTVLSERRFGAGGRTENLCSVEIWVKAETSRGTSSILTFSTENNPLQLWVHQYHDVLVVKRLTPDVDQKHSAIGVDEVFGKTEPVFLTITGSEKRTSIYVDGRLAETFRGFRIGDACRGQVVLGTAPTGNDMWAGELYGLAIYQSELTPTEVSRHFETWSNQGQPEIAQSESAVAVYKFDERAGKVAHNSIRPGIDLFIPNRYSLLHQQVLEPFWKDYKPSRSYWIDVAVNILGFVPLGFAFCAYFSKARPIKHAALATIVLGFAVSLAIEVLQSYMPTRSSSSTDVIMNTFGTILGVWLYVSSPGKALLAKFNFN